MTNTFNKLEQYLKKMGNKLKKQADNDNKQHFKQILRAELLESAEKMQRSGNKRSWSVAKRLVPATAVVVLIAFMAQFLAPGGDPTLIPKLIDVAAAYDQYEITAVDEGVDGVAVNSAFKLKGKETVKVDDVRDALKFSPVVDFDVKQDGKNEVRIIPKAELEPGEIYQLEFKELSWAFQISDDLRVTSTIPGKYGAGVPINTGVEITFSHAGVDVDDFKKAFSIAPAVNGRFEKQGRTLIFIPTGSLNEGELYTVTIAKGLPIADTEKQLTKDYVFQFETGQTEKERVGNFRITKRQGVDPNGIFEFATTEKPSFNYSYYSQDNSVDAINAKLYAYASGEDFIKGRIEFEKAQPSWTSYQRGEDEIDFKKLTLVEEYVDLEATSDAFALPQALNKGFYMLQVEAAGQLKTVFLQITDTATYISLNNKDSAVWVNDIKTGKPVKGAKVTINDQLSASTNADGVALFADTFKQLGVDPRDPLHFPVIVEANGQKTYYLSYSAWRYNDYMDHSNWQYLATDRDFYKPNDKLQYWVFLQGYEEPVNGEAEVVLYDSGSNWGVAADEIDGIIASQKVEIKDGGVVSGSFDLVNLAVGKFSYNLGIRQNGKWLARTYIYIEDYDKPAYDLELKADNRVVFFDETVDLELSANFFEGTPVPNTDIVVQGKGTFTTDALGKLTLKDHKFEISDYCVNVKSCSLYSYNTISANAANEELGGISDSLSFVVYRSKVGVKNEELEMGREGVKLTVREIDLSKIDRNSTRYSDEKEFGKVVPNSKVNVELIESEWVQEEVGEYYDFVEKVTRKKYKTVRKETVIENVNLATDSKGQLDYQFQNALKEDKSYDLNVRIYDQAGNFYDRGQFLPGKTDNSQSDVLEVVVDNNEYEKKNLGQEINVIIKGENVGGYRFLFEKNSLKFAEYTVSSKPEHQFKFLKEMIPEMHLNTVAFDGSNYMLLRAVNLQYDYDERRLDIDIATDKDEYIPGDEVKLKVNVDKGNSFVNVSLVDEAYYELYDSELVDPLYSLYDYIGEEDVFTYYSHWKKHYTFDGGGCFLAGTQILLADGTTKGIEEIKVGDEVLTRADEWSDKLVPAKVLRLDYKNVGRYMIINDELKVTGEHVMFVNGKWQRADKIEIGDKLLTADNEEKLVERVEWRQENVPVYNFEVERYHTYFADGVYVHNEKGGRSNFQDTALYKVVETNGDGVAEISFELPDNLTSWRVVATAIKGGDEIWGGSTSAQLKVSQDLFALPVINDSYLSTDKPQIPIRAFGDSLTASDKVEFKLESESLNYSQTQTGTAFKNTYFDLPLSSGEHKIATEVKAKGNEDRIILPTEVVDSRLVENAINYVSVKDGVKLRGGDKRTEITFLNDDLAGMYGVLLQGAYSNVERADYAVAKFLAGQWLNEYYDYGIKVADLPSPLYQSFEAEENDGGVSLLAYSDSELALSAKLVLLNSETWNQGALNKYFWSYLNAETTVLEKIQAATGLAALGEPMLLDLNKLLDGRDLSWEEQLWAAFAYNKMGAKAQAAEYYLAVMQQLETLDLNFRDELALKSQLAYLASELNSNLRNVLWQDVVDNYYHLDRKLEDGIILDQFLYISSRVNQGIDEEVSLKINGKKVELAGNASHRISVLADQLSKLKITDVKGNVGAISNYTVPMTANSKVDDRIEVKRYYSAGTLKYMEKDINTDELVKIQFEVSVPTDMPGWYTVTDILPSGLRPAMTTSVKWNESSDLRYPYYQLGQTNKFNVYCGRNGGCRNKYFYYYARVVNAGEFTVEPAVLQSQENTSVVNRSEVEEPTLLIKQ